MKDKSKCCGAPVMAGGIGDFDSKDSVVTQYNVCRKCKQPCDVQGNIVASCIGGGAVPEEAMKVLMGEELKEKMRELNPPSVIAEIVDDWMVWPDRSTHGQKELLLNGLEKLLRHLSDDEGYLYNEALQDIERIRNQQ